MDPLLETKIETVINFYDSHQILTVNLLLLSGGTNQ